MPQYLTSREVAVLLRRSEWWVRMMARRGELPTVRLGGRGRYLYPADQLEAALQRAGTQDCGQRAG
jgi:excisionase family DNA binding protein